MSSKSKKSAAADRPFDPETLDRARAIANQYQVIITQEDGEWFGHGLELPKTFGGGETAQACIADTIEAMTASVAYMIEQGHKPPTPAREGKRTVQVNVRLSAEEKLHLETRAKARGYEGLSDYMRVAALEHAG